MPSHDNVGRGGEHAGLEVRSLSAEELAPRTSEWLAAAGLAVPPPSALASDPRSLLVAWRGPRRIGALTGFPAPGAFRIDGVHVDLESAPEAASALVRGLAERAPGEAIQACADEGSPTLALLLDLGFVTEATEVDYERTLDDLGPPGAGARLELRPLATLGAAAATELLLRCAPPALATPEALDELLRIGELSGTTQWSAVRLDGRDVGVSLVVPWPGDPCAVTHALLALEPASRGRGLGRALLAHELRRLAAAGVRRCFETVDGADVRARGWFEASGFVESGRSRLLRLPLARLDPWLDRAPPLAVETLLARLGVDRLALDPAAGARPRGLRTRSAVRAGETLLQVPRAWLVTPSSLRAGPLGPALEPASDDLVLAVWLLLERRRPGSTFAAFVDTLPRSFPEDPSGFGPAARGALRGTTLEGPLAARAREQVAELEWARAAVPGLEALTPEELAWARAAAGTRAFGVELESGLRPCLVPALDLLNHAQPADADWTYDAGVAALVVRARRDLPAGTPVAIDYGKRSRARFLLGYGFAPEEADPGLDEVLLEVDLGAGAGPFDAFRRRLLGLGPDEQRRAVRLPARLDDPRASDAFTLARGLAADGPELAALAGPDGHFSGTTAIGPIGAANEARALALLEPACREALARLDGIDDDERRHLASDALAPSLRSCLLVRRAERAVARAWLETIRASRAALEDGRALATVEGPTSGYLTEVIGPLLRRP